MCTFFGGFVDPKNEQKNCTRVTWFFRGNWHGYILSIFTWFHILCLHSSKYKSHHWISHFSSLWPKPLPGHCLQPSSCTAKVKRPSWKFGRRWWWIPENYHDWLEHPPLEDVFPIEHGIFHCHVTFRGGIWKYFENIRTSRNIHYEGLHTRSHWWNKFKEYAMESCKYHACS